mgnify:FL=1
MLLTTKQQHRLAKVFADERHVAFEVTWSLYQSVIEAYQADQPAEGKKIMTRLITSIHSGVPAGLEELRSLGQTMKQRRDDIPAFFDHPGASNGPTEAVNGLLEHLHGTARGFRSIINYIRPVPPPRGRVQTPDPLTSVKSLQTLRRYRTITIQAGTHTITAEYPFPTKTTMASIKQNCISGS